MKRQAVVVLLTAAWTMVSVGLPVNAVTAAGPCTNIPLRFTLYNNTSLELAPGQYLPSAIRSDGGEYTNGGTTSAEIKVCAGTNDAVLNLSTSKRKFILAFPSPIAGSDNGGVPSWVPGQVAVSGWINVRNLIYHKGDNTPFTTHVGSTFNRETYRLGFMQDPVDAADLHTDPDRLIEDNFPYTSSAATVYPAYPPACTSGSRPTWLVKGLNLNSLGVMQVGTLYQIPLHGAHQHQGQYSMPFEMRIEALSCFTYP
jgi:hypothetical protein